MSFHGFVLMDTHYHALATPRTVNGCSDVTKSLNERYVRYFNRRYHRIGTLWANRPTVIPIDTERYWLTCLRYIEQNPVRARMVADPAEYSWSSYRANALGRRIDWLVSHEVYDALGRDAESRQIAYRAICGVPLSDEELAVMRTPPPTRKGGVRLPSDTVSDGSQAPASDVAQLDGLA